MLHTMLLLFLPFSPPCISLPYHNSFPFSLLSSLLFPAFFPTLSFGLGGAEAFLGTLHRLNYTYIILLVVQWSQG